VTFAGLVSRHEIIDYVAAFDIAIQPQVVAYASPLKLFEYMALARAIVAPSTPNIREVLTDGETALLFDPSDTNELRRAVERLCADPDLRDRLGTAARVAVEQKGLTWRNNARRITELFHDLLPGAPTYRRRQVGRSYPAPNDG
jgi:glycosyltransferase involved in cell wall biosynthesis